MINKKSKKNKKKGFTLIELIVVIAILGILAAILVPQILSYNNKARRNSAASDCKTIISAVQAYNADQPESSTLGTDKTLADIEGAGIVGATGTVKTVPTDIATTATLADMEGFAANPALDTYWDTTSNPNRVK